MLMADLRLPFVVLHPIGEHWFRRFRHSAGSEAGMLMADL